jgi:hypothetical protein
VYATANPVIIAKGIKVAISELIIAIRLKISLIKFKEGGAPILHIHKTNQNRLKVGM